MSPRTSRRSAHIWATSPPQAYADELRASAGLRPRGLGRRSPSSLLDRLRQHPRWPAVVGFLVVLRPVWWVTRVLVPFITYLISLGGGVGLVTLSLLAVMVMVMVMVVVVVSVELGLGRWRRQTWLAPLVLIGNVAAALALLYAVAVGCTWSSSGPSSTPSVVRSGTPSLSGNSKSLLATISWARRRRPPLRYRRAHRPPPCRHCSRPRRPQPQRAPSKSQDWR